MLARYYTLREIADISKLSSKTIRRHILSHTLPAEKSGNKYKINEDALLKWVENSPKIESSYNLSIFFDNKISLPIKSTDRIININRKWSRNFWVRKGKPNHLTFADLFSGAGGLSLGFAMAGYKPIAHIEIMPSAEKTYNNNIINRFNKKYEFESRPRDITNINERNELINYLKEQNVDVICGGFPCQGFSVSGSRVLNDDRNFLYKNMLAIVKEVLPPFVVMENVIGLRSMFGGKVEKKIISDFFELGYNIDVKEINAADYGVAQLRKRVIFIANRINAFNSFPHPILIKNKYKTVGEELQRFIHEPENKAINHIFSKHSENMKKRLLAVPEGSTLYSNFQDSWRKSPWNQPSCTIKENHGATNIHPLLPRVITPREMAALQSFPDDYIFVGTKHEQLVQIGNAVPPLLAKAIALAIEDDIKIYRKTKI